MTEKLPNPDDLTDSIERSAEATRALAETLRSQCEALDALTRTVAELRDELRGRLARGDNPAGNNDTSSGN